MYYEVYLDFYFLESFLTDVALLILVKTVMREQLKAKRIAGTAVLESMWSVSYTHLTLPTKLEV